MNLIKTKDLQKMKSKKQYCYTVTHSMSIKKNAILVTRN